MWSTRGGTRLIYDTWATPRNLIGHAAIPVQIAFLSRRAFDRTFHAYDKLLAHKPDATAIDLPGPVNFPPGGHERLTIMAYHLQAHGADTELVGRLVHLLEHADDLRGSTAFYREVGDAVAFGQVMNHFDVLRAAVAAENGAIVKYMGDAIMGVFRTPTAALRAMIEAQRRMAAGSDAKPAFGLKAGVHFGPCVAVTLNNRLDYFGSTVNMASRLEKFSTGGDVIISSVVHDDPDVLAYFEVERAHVRVEPFEATLRGFEGEPFQLWRVTLDNGPSTDKRTYDG